MFCSLFLDVISGLDEQDAERKYEDRDSQEDNAEAELR
jgi:hypothetical protein